VGIGVDWLRPESRVSMVNERLAIPLSFAEAKASGAAILWRESGELGRCSKCSVPIDDMSEVGYMGPVERDSSECSPCMDFETVCAKCEGKHVC